MNIKDIVVMRTTVTFLTILGIFPKKDDQPDKKIFKCLTLVLIGYCPLGSALYILKYIENYKEHYLEEDIMALLATVAVIYFRFQYLRSIKTVIIIYKKLSDFESFGKPRNFDKFNKILNRLAITYSACSLVYIGAIMLGPVFTVEQCKRENVKREINEICGMVFRMWLPFDYDFFPVKQILNVYQFCVIMTCAQSTAIISFSMFESIQHINCRFQHICDTFVDVVRIDDPIERRKQFRKAVQYHYALIELGNMMNNSYGPCAIVHMILTAPILGSSGYRLVTSGAVQAITLFGSWVISTTLVCTAGQVLQDSSETLSYIIYQTEWYNLEKELQRDIRLVILRSQRPIYMIAGPFGNVTNSLLLAIAKASYSYLTLLQQQVTV